MGKKGRKKKEKIEGTPDVVKFKSTRAFSCLRECVTLQESLPFVSTDPIDADSLKRVARFVHMVGVLAEFCGTDSDKSYRHLLHHKLLTPRPQLFPRGYRAELVQNARSVTEAPSGAPTLVYNGVSYDLPADLPDASALFLRQLDAHVTKIAAFVEPHLKEHFATGLPRFLLQFRDLLGSFDDLWVAYERRYLTALLGIHEEVFKPVDNLVTLEHAVTLAEEEPCGRLRPEKTRELVTALEKLINALLPNTAEIQFPQDVITLTEAALFYELPCAVECRRRGRPEEEWQELAMRVMKEYLEVRIFLTTIPQERLHPQHHDNYLFIRFLKGFHKAVAESSDLWEFLAALPPRPEETWFEERGPVEFCDGSVRVL